MQTRFLSYALHPLLIPTYLLFFLHAKDSYSISALPTQARLILFGIVFIFTFLLPATTAWVLVKIKSIRSLEMHSMEERKIPFLVTSIYYLLLYYLLKELQLPSLFMLLILAATLIVFIASLMTLFWKISIHMLGMGGACGAIWAMHSILQIDLTSNLLFVLLLSGLLAKERLQLNAHTPAQIYSGFVLGFFAEAILLQLR